MTIKDLKKEALIIRKEIINMCMRTKSGHVGSAFSVVEILVVIYNRILRGKKEDVERDRVLLSKGHACSALYAILRRKGWLSEERFLSFATNGCKLGHHPHYEPGIGLDANTGSLGHGLSIGCGLAYAAKMNSSPSRSFVILSDGETNEGSVWEAAAFAAHHKLDNICCIIDANKMQAMGETKHIIDPINHKDKWDAFGWDAKEVDGHSIEQLIAAMKSMTNTRKPTAIIAHTTKGKGISFMENNLLWHYRPPLGDEYKKSIEELDLCE